MIDQKELEKIHRVICFVAQVTQGPIILCILSRHTAQWWLLKRTAIMEMECKSSMLMVNPEEICQEPLILVLTMEG